MKRICSKNPDAIFSKFIVYIVKTESLSVLAHYYDYVLFDKDANLPTTSVSALLPLRNFGHYIHAFRQIEDDKYQETYDNMRLPLIATSSGSPQDLPGLATRAQISILFMICAIACFGLLRTGMLDH